MSLLLTHTLEDATALLRGELALPAQPAGFAIPPLRLCWLRGIEAAPGHVSFDADAAWNSVVRAWWGIGGTWGLGVAGEAGESRWNLALPGASTRDAIAAHVTGAQLENGSDFSGLLTRLRELPCRGALAGHPALGESARLDAAMLALAGADFVLLVMARPMSRAEIANEIQRLAAERQFLHDEHLARPGLENDNHAAASRCLELIEAAAERATRGLQEGAWQVRTLFAAASASDFQKAQALIYSAFAGEGGKPEPLRWQDAHNPRALTLLRSAELAALTRPPRRELPGFFVETCPVGETSEGGALFATTAPPVTGATVALGRIIEDSGAPRHWLDLALDDLCRHLLIAGMTGSGKSVSCEHLLLELWREHRLPWLVIEPGMKTGYRRLLHSEIGAEVNVWTVGMPGVRRLPLNPLAVPPGVGLAEHTEALFAIIASAFELVPPMPEVLATAIEQTYRKHGWGLAGRVPNSPPPPFAALIEEIDASTRTLGYGPEIAGNIRAGLLLRLKRLAEGPLAPEFNADGALDTPSLVSKPTIIELSALPSAESQALVMGLIALQLRHHWRLAGAANSLRHVTVIEEAHRLLRALPDTAANASRTRAVEDLAHMLAELRGFGAGLVIVDQTPAALAPSVIANTGTKLLHRLDHPDDRELTGRAAGLPADRVDILGALKPGEAILRTDRRARPYRLRMPNPAITYGALPIPELAATEPEKIECSVCGAPHCPAAAEVAKPDLIKVRLTSLQTALRQSEEAAWEWATRQLRNSGAAPGAAPLCFLMALGKAASLSETTLQRLSAAFQTRATNP